MDSVRMYVRFIHCDLFPFSRARSCQQWFCGDFVSSATMNRTHCWVHVAKIVTGTILNLNFSCVSTSASHSTDLQLHLASVFSVASSFLLYLVLKKIRFSRVISSDFVY